MKELSLDERKTLSLDILRSIDRKCHELNVRYYLAYGTLLGAVRHSGFIPWDDDIDIWVPVKEIKLLCDSIRNDGDYDVIDFWSSVANPNTFAKISKKGTYIKDKYSDGLFEFTRGIAVDVFPLYGCDNERNIQSIIKCKHMIQRRRIFRLGGYRKKDSNLAGLIKDTYLQLDAAIHPDELYWNKKYFKLTTTATCMSKIGCPSSPYGQKDVFAIRCFQGNEMLTFENEQFRVPCGFREILESLYGDYMQLPPPEKRISNHDVTAYSN